MNETDIYYILTLTLNSISVVSCLFLVFIFLMVRKIYSFSLELVVYLVITGCLYNATYYLPGNNDHPIICQIQGVLSIFFDLNALLWAMIIGQMSYSSLMHHEYISNNKTKLRIIFFLITILIPLAFSLLAYFFKVITISTEEDERYCWFDFTQSHNDPKHITTMAFGMIYLAICWSGIFYSSFCIIALIVKIRQLDISHDDKMGLIMVLIKYPIVLLINYLPTTVVTLIEVIKHSSEMPNWCVYTELVLESLSGFFYAIAFGYNKDIRYAIKHLFCCYEDSLTGEDNDNNINSLNHSVQSNNYELEKLNGTYLDSYDPSRTIKEYDNY